MAMTLLIGGVSAVLALWAGKYNGGQYEILNIYRLLISYLEAVFALLAFISLYNYKDLTSRMLLCIFGPISGLLLVHMLTTLVWDSPSIYSLDEYFVLVGLSPGLIIRTLVLLSVLVGIVMLVLKFFRARKVYGEMLNDYFSGEEELRRSRWIDRSFAVMLLSVVFFTGASLITSPYYDLFCRIFFAGGAIYFTVKFISYRGQSLRIVPAVEFAGKTTPEVYGHPDSAVGILLVQWVSRPDKPYLAPGLSLGDLSQMTGVNKRRLSEHINGRFSMTFNTWINSLRLREVERMLTDRNYSKTLPEIASATGFADLADMNGVFRKTRGISPSRFRQFMQD